MFVKGVTPQLLLGNDQNRNGVLDPEEDDGSGTLDRGWSAYLTVYSREQNVDSQGNPRIYVNDQDLDSAVSEPLDRRGAGAGEFHRRLSPLWAGADAGGEALDNDRASQVRRQQHGSRDCGFGRWLQGGTGGSGGGASASLSRNQVNFRSGRPKPISSLYELIGTEVSIPGDSPQAQPKIYRSPLNDPGRSSSSCRCCSMNAPR